jgi:RNA polymerase sigma factor (sigma-70 family)
VIDFCADSDEKIPRCYNNATVKSVVKEKLGSFVSDDELIEGCLDGVAECWEQLIRRYQNLIYSVPLHYHFSQQDAADVFQTVCLILLQKLKTLRNTKTVSTWIYTTTRRECWKVAKKRKMEMELGEGIDVWEWVEPDMVLQHQIRTKLEKLNQKCKTLLEALYYSDPPLTYHEISRKLRIPEGSIGPSRARCLKQLRKLLGNK